MFNNLKFRGLLALLVCTEVGPMTVSAPAVTAEVAKKCDALTMKAFPPRVPGNPAAGTAKGTPRSVRSYFTKCVAKGGNLNDRVRAK
jgi:hypothetical protein